MAQAFSEASPDEASRLRALQRTDLLEGPPPESLERLVRLCSRLLDAPLALVNLIDQEQQVSVSCVSPPNYKGTRITSLDDSFCKFTVQSRAPLRIDDTSLDPLVSSTRTAREGLRAYLGVPLITRDGSALGTLCVADLEPRAWSDDDLHTLQDLASLATAELDRRLAVRDTREAVEERSEAERERREKTALLQSTREGIYGIDLDGKCTFINRAACRMLGYREDEVIGRNMHRLIHHSHSDGTEYPEHDCLVYQAVHEGRIIQVEDEFLWRSDGSGFPAAYASSPIREASSISGAVITFSDLTERRNREKDDRFLNSVATRLSEQGLDFRETLHAIANLAVPRLGTVSYLQALEEGRQELVVEAHAREGMGAIAARLRRQQVSAATLGGLNARNSALVERVTEEEIERLLPGADWETWRSLEVQSLIVVPLASRGHFLGRLILARLAPEDSHAPVDLDVAREFGVRCAYALDNSRLYRDSLEASRTKTEFLATISHELRTPLNGILGYTGLLKEGVAGSLPAQAMSYVGRVDISARRLRQLVDEILTFSDLEAGREKVEPEYINVADMVDELTAIVRPLAEEKGLQIDSEKDEQLVRMSTDPVKLRQILLNLLDNAVKFTASGSVTLTARQEGEVAIFEVTDTGIGVEPDQVSRAFEPFRQLEQSTTRAVGGAGLGLTVALWLTRLLGGDLSLSGTAGQGTQARVRLPLEYNRRPPTAED